MARKAADSAKPAAVKIAAPERFSARTRVGILFGEDRYMQDEHLRLLREALAKELGGAEAFDIVRFDGGQPSATMVAEIFDECRSFGLMQQHKVVIVDNADLLLKKSDDEDAAPAKGRRAVATADARKLMESYAADPSDSATLVLRASTWRPGNLDKAVAALGERGAIIKCETLDPARAAGWAVKRAALRHNTTLDPEAARLLVAAVGADLGRIDNEIEKLALAAGGQGAPVTADLVRAMTGQSREEEFWRLQSTIASGDARATLAHMREMVEVSRHDEVMLTWCFVELAKKVHAVRRLADAGENLSAYTNKLRLWGDSAGVFNAARRLHGRQAARLLDRTVSTDLANKSGRGEPYRNLETLAIEFSQAFAPR
ncbi:MAG: DNA polymerase III subunit delta [Phycisphaeraceae bacterium]|nr:DNA polymerase III subunit delta [Phycisphaeraceae bacterium]